MPHLPTVFLSSTYYDLQQVRADLVCFIQETLGYRCLASEVSSFPIDPDVDTVENCQRRVDQDADALVLVVGGRYGTIPETSNRSVTNLEYLVARAKGIPIYVFVKADILSMLSLWKDNKDVDFSSVVDNPRLFDFISEIRGPHSVWMQPFSTAQDIINALRQQFAYLMSQGISLQARLRGTPKEYAGFSGRALRIALERPEGWQGLLIAQLIEEEISSAADLRFTYDRGVIFGSGDYISEENTINWHDTLVEQANRIVLGTGQLVNDALYAGLKANDNHSVALCARAIGKAYRDAIEWSNRIRRAYVREDWVQLFYEISSFTRNIIDKLEGLPEHLRRAIDDVLANKEIGNVHSQALPWITIDITIANLDGYRKAYEALKLKRGA